MINNITKIFMAVAICSANIAAQNNINIKGSNYSSESRQAAQLGEAALVKGLFSYGTVIYQIKLPSSADRVSFKIRFNNLRNKWLKVYIYNYGVSYDDLSVRNKRLAPNWRLWEATNTSGLWESHSPKYLYTTSYDGRIDFLGSQNTLKLLLYADGGIPYISDGRFVIEQITVEFSTSDKVVSEIITSKDVWIEGNYLLVRGQGYSKSRIDQPGYEAIPRAAALRLSKVDAYKKLAIALGRISPKGGTAAIPGSRVRSTLYKSDTEVEIILEVPLASLHDKP